MDVPDLVKNPARRYPDRICIAEGERALTFAEVDARASRAAAAMRALGVEPGDRVALLAENELEYLELQVAAQRAQAVLVPMNFRLAIAELEFLIADCKPAMFIHGPGYGDKAAGLGVEPTLHLGEQGHGQSYDDVIAAHEPLPDAALEASAPACILYTSGTTGRPKGATLTNMSLYARCASMAIDFGTRPGSVFVQTLPMFHISANTAYSFTYTGSTIVLMKAFSPQAVVETVNAVAATHLLMVPDTINMLSNSEGIDQAEFDTLQLLIYGGSSIAPEVLRRAMSVFGCGFLQLYGMTETSACSILRPEDHDPVAHPELLPSAGTDAISFETSVVDLDGNPCPVGEVGEIVARGPGLMVNYWRAPEATAEAMAGGWMHTGDLGYRAESGHLFVTDRLKDMIVTGGENVYPREVEDVLYEHPDVMEASVVGLPDEKWGERVHAVVVAREGAAPEADELLTHIRAHIASYKCPKTLEFIDALPKNAMGKILKRQLRAERSST